MPRSSAWQTTTWVACTGESRTTLAQSNSWRSTCCCRRMLRTLNACEQRLKSFVVASGPKSKYKKGQQFIHACQQAYTAFTLCGSIDRIVGTCCESAGAGQFAQWRTAER